MRPRLRIRKQKQNSIDTNQTDETHRVRYRRDEVPGTKGKSQLAGLFDNLHNATHAPCNDYKGIIEIKNLERII